MGKAGSIDRLLVLAEIDWQHDKLIEQSEQYQQAAKGLANTLAAFKEIGKSCDLDLIIQAEEAMVMPSV